MYKLRTKIRNYRYNNDHVFQLPTPIDWYKLKESEDDSYQGTCFTMDELEIFTAFVINNPNNFSKSNYHICNEAECPECTIYGRFPRSSGPTYNLIIKNRPVLSDLVYPCMEVILTDETGNDNHNYNLPFNVIGHIFE